jgi:hypothetical protein
VKANALSLLSHHCIVCHQFAHISWASLLVLSHLDIEMSLCTIEVGLEECKYLSWVYTVTFKQGYKGQYVSVEMDTVQTCADWLYQNG